jgi:hypothetical protein
LNLTVAHICRIHAAQLRENSLRGKTTGEQWKNYIFHLLVPMAGRGRGR